MKKIITSFTIIAVLALVTGAFAQQHDKHANASIEGTWDMTLQSHQLALVLKQDGKKVTGTLMLPGKDIAVEGEYAAGKLSLVTTGGDANAMPMKLEGKLQDDGTLAGEFVSARGNAKWTAERLKERK